MKMIKKDSESKQEITTEIYLKKIKIKRENMEETYKKTISKILEYIYL